MSHGTFFSTDIGQERMLSEWQSPASQGGNFTLDCLFHNVQVAAFTYHTLLRAKAGSRTIPLGSVKRWPRSQLRRCFFDLSDAAGAFTLIQTQEFQFQKNQKTHLSVVPCSVAIIRLPAPLELTNKLLDGTLKMFAPTMFRIQRDHILSHPRW